MTEVDEMCACRHGLTRHDMGHGCIECRCRGFHDTSPEPTPAEQAVIDRFDPFRRERVLADLQREIDRSVRRALGTDPGAC